MVEDLREWAFANWQCINGTGIAQVRHHKGYGPRTFDWLSNDISQLLTHVRDATAPSFALVHRIRTRAKTTDWSIDLDEHRDVTQRLHGSSLRLNERRGVTRYFGSRALAERVMIVALSESANTRSPEQTGFGVSLQCQDSSWTLKDHCQIVVRAFRLDKLYAHVGLEE